MLPRAARSTAVARAGILSFLSFRSSTTAASPPENLMIVRGRKFITAARLSRKQTTCNGASCRFPPLQRSMYTFYKHTPIRISYLHRLFSRRRSRFSHIQSMFDSFLGICWRLSIPAPCLGEGGILTLSQTTLCPGPDHLHCRFSAERCRLCSVGVSRRRGCLVGVIIFSPEDDISRSGASSADLTHEPALLVSSGYRRLRQ